MSEKKSIKKRNWAFVLYPDSAPGNWQEILQQTGLSIAISPLHDKDFNATGEPKKAHRHIIACYSGPTSYNVVKGLTDSLNQPIPQPLEQIRGYYRYLTHKDNPDKAQYSDSDIVTLNGFNISDFVELTRSEVDSVKKNVLSLIQSLNFDEYCDLVDYVMYNGDDSTFSVVTSNTLFFNSYLKSRRFKHNSKHQLDT